MEYHKKIWRILRSPVGWSRTLKLRYLKNVSPISTKICRIFSIFRSERPTKPHVQDFSFLASNFILFVVTLVSSCKEDCFNGQFECTFDCPCYKNCPLGCPCPTYGKERSYLTFRDASFICLYHWDLKKRGDLRNMAQWVSRAPPHHTLPAFLNFNGRYFIK